MTKSRALSASSRLEKKKKKRKRLGARKDVRKDKSTREMEEDRQRHSVCKEDILFPSILLLGISLGRCREKKRSLG